jgi:ABC-2 type transport system permease protein
MTRTDVALLWRWTRTRLTLMRRTPRAVFFTFAFPLLFLLLFASLNGDTRLDAFAGGGTISFAQFYTPSIGVFGLTMACYSGIVLGLATARDAGILKRVRSTPLPMWIYLSSWLAGAALTGLAAVVLMFAVAVPVFDVHVYARLLPAAVVTIVLGAFSLTALGLAVCSLVRSADQAMPIAQLTVLPLSFISGVFYPLAGAPAVVLAIARVFPLYHLVNAFDRGFQPQTAGGGWSPRDLAVLALWGAGALWVASRRFGNQSDEARGGRPRSLAARAA